MEDNRKVFITDMGIKKKAQEGSSTKNYWNLGSTWVIVFMPYNSASEELGQGPAS